MSDEPLANLDAQTRQLMHSELLKIWETTGKSILFVTHSIEEAIFLSDRIAVLTAAPGQIMETVDVDFPRPRNDELRTDTRFVRMRSYVWGKLKEAIRK